MNYGETLEWLYSRLPMFTRIGAAAIKKDLTNTLLICELLGNPQKKFKSIHIAGTNGKGSVSHMLASVLQEAGYKTGLYTSPHLKDFRERIKINGEMITEEYVVDFVAKHQPDVERIEPSFFEMTVALAFDYFADQKVDVAVIETGLGGRLDSTNIVSPELSIITNIGWDHTDLLGDSLEKIAGEKAGIIKPGIPVVVGETLDETKPVFVSKADESGSPIIFAEEYYEVQDFIVHKGYSSFNLLDKINHTTHAYQCQLNGIYQSRNIVTLATAWRVLEENDLFRLNRAHLERGLAHVVDNTGLKGRWQQLGEKPLIFCDTGHNKEGLTLVMEQLKLYDYKRLHIVFGVVKDKDLSAVFPLLPSTATYYFCQASIPRALPAEELREKAKAYNLVGESYPSVEKALQSARSAAGEDDMIFVGGSTFVVAEII